MRISSLIVFIFLCLFYLVLPVIMMFMIKKNKKLKIFAWGFLGVFLSILIVGVLGKIDITKETVYIGFDFSQKWCNKIINFKFNNIKLDKLINICMLMPGGEVVFLNAKVKNKNMGFIFSIVIGIITGLVIETLQFILPVSRSVQLSDAIYNCISCVIGYLYLAIFYYLKRLICLIYLKHKQKY